jgi:SAM-dependent methyltransferase
LKCGTVEQFRTVRNVLQQSSYTEDAICKRLKLESIYDFRSTLELETKLRTINDALDLLIALFMDGESVSEAQLNDLLPEAALENFDALGLIGRDDEYPGKCFTTAFLYPVESVYIASDRTIPANQKSQAMPDDVVYAAITANTRRFLAALPEKPCGSFLDLCSGTGVAALIAAKRYATHAWSCDVTERSARFAEFNRCLNELENVTVARGDLYEPVRGRRFDRIVAHPPYIPAVREDKPRVFFRDGGEDGEVILQRIVEGLPDHLAPDGRFYAVTLATDREGENFEHRIRRWLGPAASDFDVVLMAYELKRRPEDIIATIVARGWMRHMGPTVELYERLKVTAVFYGAVMIHRKAADRPCATARGLKSANVGREALEWLYEWETAAVQSDFARSFLECCPSLSPNLRLIVTHTPEPEGLVPSEFTVKSDYPFVVNATCPPWLAVVLGACTGSRTTEEIFDDMKAQQVLNPDMSRQEFVDLLRVLGSNALIQIPHFAPMK